MAHWPGGFAKWKGVVGVILKNTEKLLLKETGKESKEKTFSKTADDHSNKLFLSVVEIPRSARIKTRITSVHILCQGDSIVDSLFHGRVKVGEKTRLVYNTQSEPILENASQITFTNYTGRLTSATVERVGKVRIPVKPEGTHKGETGRE